MYTEKRKRSGGFTLVELLIVVVIIGVLLGLLLPAVQVARESSRQNECASHLKQIGTAMLNFESACRGYPPSLTGVNGLSFWGLIPPYMDNRVEVGSTVQFHGFNPDGGLAPYNPTVTGNTDTITANASHANFAHGYYGVTPKWRNCPSRGGNRRSTNGQTFCWNGGTLPPAYSTSRVSTCDYAMVLVGSSGNSTWGFATSLCAQPPTSGSGSDVSTCSGSETVHNTGRLGCQVLNIASIGRRTSVNFTGCSSPNPSTYVSGQAVCAAGTFVNMIGFPNGGNTWTSPRLDQPFSGWYPRSRTKDVTDGTSKTVVIAEKHIPSSRLGRFWDHTAANGNVGSNDGPPFYDGTNQCAYGQNVLKVRADQIGIARRNDDMTTNWQFRIGSYHMESVNMLFADGAVRPISRRISDLVLQRLADRRDGVTEYSWLNGN